MPPTTGVPTPDEGERKYIRETGMKVYTMHEIDRLGMTKVIEETIEYLSANCDGIHLSLDLDGLDPSDAPGVGTPVVATTGVPTPGASLGSRPSRSRLR